MSWKNILMVVAVLMFMLSVGGCGGGSGGGVSEFKTVYVGDPEVTSGANPNYDIASWVGDTCGVGTPEIFNENATFTIANTAYPGTLKASAVTITTGKLTFTPADTFTEELPSAYIVQYFPVDQTFSANTNQLVSVEIVSHAMKSYIESRISCTKNTFTYYVTVSFNVVEVNTNIKKTISSQMKISFLDLAG